MVTPVSVKFCEPEAAVNIISIIIVVIIIVLIS